MRKSEAVAEIYAWLASQASHYPAGIPEKHLHAEPPIEQIVRPLGAPFGEDDVQLLFLVRCERNFELSEEELELLSGAVTKGLKLDRGKVGVVLVDQGQVEENSGAVCRALLHYLKESGARFGIDCGGVAPNGPSTLIAVPPLSDCCASRESKRALWEGLKVIKSQLLGKPE